MSGPPHHRPPPSPVVDLLAARDGLEAAVGRRQQRDPRRDLPGDGACWPQVWRGAGDRGRSRCRPAAPRASDASDPGCSLDLRGVAPGWATATRRADVGRGPARRDQGVPTRTPRIRCLGRALRRRQTRPRGGRAAGDRVRSWFGALRPGHWVRDARRVATVSSSACQPTTAPCAVS